MPVSKGDFILLDYTARIKETNEVFDTSMEDVARKEGVYREGVLYEPMLVVVGEGWVLKGLDEALEGLEVEKNTTIELPPEKAFGQRDPAKIKLIPLRYFRERNITPTVGMQVDIDGKLATVRAVGAGRVQVDFNPPLAGKTLVYEVIVRKILTEPLEKIKALIHRRIPNIKIEKFKLKLTKTKLTVEMPEESFLISDIGFRKRGIAADIHKFFPEIDTVSFVETYKRREKEKKTKSS